MAVMLLHSDTRQRLQQSGSWCDHHACTLLTEPILGMGVPCLIYDVGLCDGHGLCRGGVGEVYQHVRNGRQPVVGTVMGEQVCQGSRNVVIWENHVCREPAAGAERHAVQGVVQAAPVRSC